MLLDEQGVMAIVVTLHPGALLLAVFGASLAAMPFGWWLKATASRRAPLWLAAFFLGVVLLGHSLVLQLASLRPPELEVVRIRGDDLAPRE